MELPTRYQGAATPEQCTTDSNGDCTFTGFVGSSIGFGVTSSAGLDASGSGIPSAVGNTLTIQLPAPSTTFTLSGVLTDSSGDPVAGTFVSADSNTTNVSGSTMSGADGSYSLALPAGSYMFLEDGTIDGMEQSLTINDLSISANLVENFSFPAVGTVTVNVVDSNGNAFSGADIRGESSPVDASTQDGTPYQISGFAGNCTTDSNGDCTFTGFVGSSIGFGVTTSAGLDASGSGIPSAVGSTVRIQLPAPSTTFTLSGVLTDSSGNPVAGTLVSALSNTTNFSGFTTSAADGSYSLALPVGSYMFVVPFATVDGVRQSLTIDNLSISGNLVENFSFAAVGTITVGVVDSNGNAVPGAEVRAKTSAVNGTTQDGTPYQISAAGALKFPDCTTGSNGDCTMTGFVGSLFQFLALLPGGLATPGGSGSPSPDGNTVIIQLADYATVLSEGSTPGTISISAPEGTELTNISDSVATTNGLPAGSVAMMGALSYDVDVVPGASAKVVLNLPAGSDPTNVFKYQHGKYVNVTSLASICGQYDYADAQGRWTWRRRWERQRRDR